MISGIIVAIIALPLSITLALASGVTPEKGIRLILSHNNEQPMHMMEKAGFDKRIGKEYFCKYIDDALALAERIAAK